jgi:hypothetical protein
MTAGLPGTDVDARHSVPGTLFAGTEVSFPLTSTCALCHSRIPPPSGSQPVSIAQVALWQGSMMAHSSRDPFWKAKLQDETTLTPAAATVIEDKCLRCHAPSQQYLTRESGGMAFRDLDAGGEGVTCTVCHQIAPRNLGSPASFTGGFEINRESEIYGPHKNPFRMPMLHHTGLAATYSSHVLESSFCGTCHTVITPTLTPEGRVTGQFVEQAPYLEWLASDYPKLGATCQTCHVRQLRDSGGTVTAQYIAHMPPGRWFPPTRPRMPFGLHFFAGANSPMLNLLADSEPENAAALRSVAQKADENLRSALSLDSSALVENGVLRVTVEVTNRTGHKLPTGFPSRRIWLHVEAFSAGGERIFESGGWDPATGEIRAAVDQPHRAVISRADQVMLYQAVTADAAGRRTDSLLQAASYLKDNRIPPAGFDRTRDARIAPVGTSNDSGFQAGAHTVRYQIPLRPRVVPTRVRVEAMYQSVDPAYVPADRKHALTVAMGAIRMAEAEVSLKSKN